MKTAHIALCFENTQFFIYSLQNNSDHKAVINKDPEQGQTSSWTLLVNY